MTGLSITAIVFLCLGTSCAVISSLLVYQEIGEVNRKLPDEEQISYFFMYPGKMAKIKAEYKRLYPKGRVEFWRFVLQAAVFVFLALAAIAGGFLR